MHHFLKPNAVSVTLQIETNRLHCRPLTLQEYSIFELGQEPKWVDLLNPHRHLVEGPNPLSHRLLRVKKDPSFAEIGLVLAIEKESKELVGSAGFHDFPNEVGMIEIGFGIVPERQNRGFGQELLLGMWKAISARNDVKVLRYTVAPDNAPSLHIINKLGFTQVGQQMDPEDGLELIFEKSSLDFLKDFST